MEHAEILWALAGIFGFYMAWNIGANDVANAMGTSVGSGALTLRRAVIIAAMKGKDGNWWKNTKYSKGVRWVKMKNVKTGGFVRPGSTMTSL